MDLNGNGITVSNAVWAEMKKTVPVEDGKPKHPIRAAALKPVVESYKAQGKPFNLGMIFPVATHNYDGALLARRRRHQPGLLRTAEGRHQRLSWEPSVLSVTPPPQMPATLEAGTIVGYCVGEPWNQQAVSKGIGVPVITDYEHLDRTLRRRCSA